MQVDTGAFRALSDEVERLAAEVQQLQRDRVFKDALMDVLERAAYAEGRESVLGRSASPPPRLRHLRPVDGGSP